ncbi:MAG: PEP/pyruvate-binding domain-containing protein [bacterium]
MSSHKEKGEDLGRFYRERAKELECLYQIEELLLDHEARLADVCRRIVDVVSAGWQYPDVCRTRIAIGSETFQSEDFVETPWGLTAEIAAQDQKMGSITVVYLREMPAADEGPFLKQERRLLKTIAHRLGNFVLQQQLGREAEDRREEMERESTGEWRVALNLLHHTDPELFETISEKMLNHLCWTGVEEANLLRQKMTPAAMRFEPGADRESNVPYRLQPFEITDETSDEIFRIAAKTYTSDEILDELRKWIQDDKLSFLLHLSYRNLSLSEVIGALRQYRDMVPEGFELSEAAGKGVVVALIRRFLSTQLAYINIAKKYIGIRDFFDILDRIIYTPENHGLLGGKCAGLLLAQQIITKSFGNDPGFANIKVPKSWYLPSDVLLGFVRFNKLDEVVEQKYKDINQVRLEYPHVIHTFKDSRFPPEIVQGLSMALDEFGAVPLIIRSSSLLEDSLGAAFSGKYKSLFLANQGSKNERLRALLDAIAEVYASTFGPDPIEYRAERGLLDFSEEMGIMIQGVVGTRIGDYFFPAFAGVAFSRNEFRWSPRISREDGLIRMVPGLGTRAVDRVSDDYPVLVAPRQPGLRVNVAPEEIVYYSPRKIDVINLKANTFETLDVAELVRKHGADMPLLEKMVSVYDGHHLRRPLGMQLDFEKDTLAFTFEGLLSDSPFVKQIHSVLRLLEEKLGTPVDIEFAHDGTNFYLLQCRPQSYSQESAPAPIPKDVSPDRVIFTANRYVSNGRVRDITHIVYVDPLKYSDLPNRDDLVAVGRAVGKLNKLLPKRQFVLMGPGRWGSRGDIKLGVSVTYSEINNTAALIEIARKKGNYSPDLSFGTHFFQDLVEGQIRYLPLFPDDKGIIFNERFLNTAPNILSELLPEHAGLADVVRLIDVPQATDGYILRLLMNAELSEAVAILAKPAAGDEPVEPPVTGTGRPTEQTWTWRHRMAEYIASQLDPDRFGAVGFYVFGSTKNATAGLGSDIDILIHFRGTDAQREQLMIWLNGWSLCLDEINYLRTGYRTGGLLDVHIVTDEDIANKTSFAVKIGAVTDAARPLALKKKA